MPYDLANMRRDSRRAIAIHKAHKARYNTAVNNSIMARIQRHISLWSILGATAPAALLAQSIA